MRSTLLVWLAASLLTVRASPAPLAYDHQTLQRRALTVPADDPFYSAPAYDSQKPGTIIRTREVELASIGLVPASIKSAHQFLHWSIDLYGKPQANMATLILPTKQQLTKDGVPRLVVYQVAEDSAWSACAPSYQFRAGGQGNLLVQEEIVTMNHILDKGWTLVVTDYEGPQSAFTVGELAATGVLDAVRASLNFDLIVAKAKSHLVQVALMGYSGGALASGWALQQQPSYAPELSQNLVAGILGGLPVNIKTVLLKQNGNAAAGLVGTGLAGQANGRPDVLQYLQDHMSPEGLDVVAAVNRTCLPQALANNLFTDFFKYFDVSQEEVLAAEPIRNALEAGILGRPGTPISSVPRFAYVATEDEVVSGPDVDAYVKDQCAAGASITYVRENVADHLSLTLTGAAKAFIYLEDRFNGVATSGCSSETVALSLQDPQALFVFGTFVLSQLNVLLAATRRGFVKSLAYSLGSNLGSNLL